MATLHLQDIPDKLYQEVEKIAGSAGYSLNTYVVLLFKQAVEAEQLRRQRTETLTAIRQRRENRQADVPNSVDLLREIRA